MKFRFSARFSMWVATFFGSGKLPIAPGTWGSLAALVLLFLPESFRADIVLAFILVFSIISIGIIEKLQKVYGKDPQFIVIDEAIAIWILMLSPFFNNFISGLICFTTFRIFDIVKPYPLNKINEKEGAIYVILDDIGASVYTLIIMLLLNKYIYTLI